MFTVIFGVKQGSVLSPILFAIYIDNLSTIHQLHVMLLTEKHKRYKYATSKNKQRIINRQRSHERSSNS